MAQHRGVVVCIIRKMPGLPRKKKTVLVASRDSNLADVRKRVLEDAGYEVLSARSINEVRDACTEQAIHLVIVGYSLPPAEKRRVCNEARKHCNTPILEMYDSDPPELHEHIHVYTHHSITPEDFIEAVNAILKKR